MKPVPPHKHQSSHRRGEFPHLIVKNFAELEHCRLKAENYHGSTGCTVSPAIISLNFLQSKPK